MDCTEYSSEGGCDEAWVNINSLIQPSTYITWRLLIYLSRFVSRATPKSNDRHVILGVVGYDPRKFAEQMNLNLANGWGIVRTIIDMVRGMKEGKYVLVKDPNKSLLRLYGVPLGSFEEGEEEDGGEVDEADGADE